MLTKIAKAFATIAAVYLAIATALTFWPAPHFAHPATVEEFRARQIAGGIVLEQRYKFDERHFTMRDGGQLFARVFEAPSHTTVLMLHGVTADSSLFNTPAGLVREASGARVIALDLRGHGQSSGRPWNVDYLGQYDDDIVDVIRMLRKEDPNGKIILMGHSMGGGIALRYGLLTDAPPVDGYVLVAPLLGAGAPTNQRPKGAARSAANQTVLFNTTRMIGVVMFHAIGLRQFNALQIMTFNEPRAPAYGFGALASMQPNPPNDYKVALKAIKQPLFIVAGGADRTFNAAGYPAAVAGHTNAKALIVDGASHSGVLIDPRAVNAIGEWIKERE